MRKKNHNLKLRKKNHNLKLSLQRRRIDLLDKLRTGKGLSKKRKNIIGGNFNVVENDR